MLTTACSCIMKRQKNLSSDATLNAEKFANTRSPVAQSVERLAVNQHVRGSSPRWGARIKEPNNKGWAFLLSGFFHLLISSHLVNFYTVQF